MSGACSAARAFLRRGEAPPAPDPDAPQRATLLSVPFFHATGCFAMLNPSLFGGAKLVMMRRWDPVRAFELIERERITSAGGVPTIAWQLIEHPLRKNYDLSSLESVAYGGAPSAPELVRQIKETFPKSAARQRLGHDRDLGHGHHTTAPRTTSTAPTSCGPPVPVTDLKIMTVEGDRELPIGEVGELWCKGPQVVKGYWNKPEATAQTFVRRLGQDRRPGAAGRGGLLLHHRPRQGHADPRRREHLLHRGGERPLRPSGGDGRRPGGHPAQDPGRGAGRRRHPETGREATEKSCAPSSPSAWPPSKCR